MIQTVEAAKVVFTRSYLVDDTAAHAASLGEDFCPDPDPILGEVFVVIAEDSDGFRWQHERGFRDEVEANLLHECIAGAISEGRTLNEKYWFEVDPCYGSEAYIKTMAERDYYDPF